MASSANPKKPAARVAVSGRVLDDRERMMLIGADRDAFLAAVLDPPEPTEKLVAALRRHRAMLG